MSDMTCECVEAETYRQMHETARELGYPSILEALEALERLSQPSEKREEPSEAWPAGMRRVVHELRLSAQVFRDYERQHEYKALEAPRAREAEERRRKAKRNGDRAAACEEALAALGEPPAMRAAAAPLVEKPE
jgi:hypothetical protein